ncbi:toxin Cry1Ac domain D-VI-related protein [Enterococcus hirae]|nr:toxin Cry1Ac domain D-VI-related protein [Enterococcus hirae]
MNYKKTIAFMMLSTTILGTAGNITTHADTMEQVSIAQQTDQNQEVTIPDVNLKKALNETLDQAPDTQITSDQLATIKELDVNNKEIQSIEGLQYCVNLRKLMIGNDFMHTHETNTISDLSPLKNLTQLAVLVTGNLKIADFSPLKSLPLNYCTDEDMSGSYLGTQTVEITLNTDKYTELTLKNPMIDSQGKAITPDSISTEGICNYEYEPTTNNFSFNYQPVYKDSQEKEDKLAFAGADFKNEISYTKNTDLVHGRMTLVLSTHVNSLFQQATRSLNSLFKDKEHKKFKEQVTKEDFVNIFNILQELSEKYPTSGFMHKEEVREFTKKLHDAALLFTTQKTEGLFLDNSETALAKDVTQQKLDTVRDDVNQLLKQDQENKDLLLKKINKAQQLLDQKQAVDQKIEFKGLGGAHFGQLEIKNNKATFNQLSSYIHPYFDHVVYASVLAKDKNGQILFNKAIQGTDTPKLGATSFNLPEGSAVEIYHAEPSMLQTEQQELKTNSFNNTFYYVVKDGVLVNQMHKADQSFDFYGLGENHYANLEVTNGKAVYHQMKNYIHPYFVNKVYSSISVKDGSGKSIFEKKIIGDKAPTTGDSAFDLPEGATVSIYHAEGNSGRYTTSNDQELKQKTVGNTFNYVVKDGVLVQLS